VFRYGIVNPFSRVMYDWRTSVDTVSVHPKPGPNRAPGAQYFVGAVAILALIGGLSSSVASETRCTRDGDWLVCENGERYAIRTDSFSRPRLGLGRIELGPSSDATRDNEASGAALLQSSDGLVCWAHGDHAHCQ
jgi:hypothetical protein